MGAVRGRLKAGSGSAVPSRPRERSMCRCQFVGAHPIRGESAVLELPNDGTGPGPALYGVRGRWALAVRAGLFLAQESGQDRTGRWWWSYRYRDVYLMAVFAQMDCSVWADGIGWQSN